MALLWAGRVDDGEGALGVVDADPMAWAVDLGAGGSFNHGLSVWGVSALLPASSIGPGCYAHVTFLLQSCNISLVECQ